MNGGTASTRPVCRRCGNAIYREVYELRLVLESADPSAPREQVDKTAAFHPGCAAWLFRAFDGVDLAEAIRWEA